MDINLTVSEKGQQSIGLTGGISGYRAFIGINYSTNNFLGSTATSSPSTPSSGRAGQFFLRVHRPVFLDTNSLFGFSVYNRRRYDVNDYTYYYQTSDAVR